MIKLLENKEYVSVDFGAPSLLNRVDDNILYSLEKIINHLEDESLRKIIVFSGLGVDGYEETAPISFDYCRRWEKLLAQISRLSAVTIAVVNGVCVKLSLQLALICDYRLATAGSVFVSPELKEGYLPGMSTFLLAKYVGFGISKHILFTGMPFKVADAKMLGLVDRIFLADKVDYEITKLVNELTPVNGTAIQLVRRLLNESFYKSYEEAIGNFLAAQHICLNHLKTINSEKMTSSDLIKV